jgi:hypothetical protein
MLRPGCFQEFGTIYIPGHFVEQRCNRVILFICFGRKTKQSVISQIIPTELISFKIRCIHYSFTFLIYVQFNSMGNH